MEILGRSLRWTEKGLEYEESKTVIGAASKPEEIGQEGDVNVLDEAERKKFTSLAATLK